MPCKKLFKAFGSVIIAFAREPAAPAKAVIETFPIFLDFSLTAFQMVSFLILSRNIVRNKVYQHEAYQVVKITPSNNLRDRYRKQNTENEDK